MLDPGISPNARLLAGDIQAPRTIWGRVGHAFSVSLMAHAAGLLLVAYVISRLPDGPPANSTFETPSHITWVAQAAEGPGGGGSGNERSEPARRAELPGRAPLTVPVKKPLSTAPQEIADPPKLQQPLQIPAVMTEAGVRELPGVISELTPVSSTDSQGSGIGGRGGRGQGSGDGPGDGPGLGPGRNGGTGGGPYSAGNGVVPPRLTREIRPGYTSEAMRARIQGLVALQAVVLPDGSVGSARVVRSLDSTFGLDEEAVKTIKMWRFIPGTLAGRAVPVLIEIELTFTLR
jgi:protein TonB